MICKNCGTQNSADDEICKNCGAELDKSDVIDVDDDTYGEFGIGAKIWFWLCCVSSVLTSMVSLVIQIGTMSKYGASFSGLLNIIAYAGAIFYGVAYAKLAINRKKDNFKFIVKMEVAVAVVLTLAYAFNGSAFSELLIFAVLEAIGCAANIGITYAILSKYGGDKLPDISKITGGANGVDENTATIVEEGSGICCPKCGSNNLQAVSESNTTGGGYGAGKGCCGYILLGPLGLLCGACGSKAKTTNKTFFVCMNCGNKFAK